MAEIVRVEHSPLKVTEKKRVAAYARISKDTESSLPSLKAQVDYYTRLIGLNTDWELVGIYADEGISGTSIKRREGFKALLKDCDDGKVDLVLTKSISRFARDTVDCLATIRHLKAIGIEVRFERENISTMTTDGELLLTLLASFAQEEAESISKNIRWSVAKRHQQGIPTTDKRCFGYDWDAETKTCVINEEQAEVVKYIFAEYLGGASLCSLEKDLQAKGIKGRYGNPIGRTSIRYILGNEVYTGDILLQKYVSTGIKKRKRNSGELPQYLVSDAHPAIISHEDFDAVQDLLSQRVSLGSKFHAPRSKFSGLVKCGVCGHSCIRTSYSRGKLKNRFLCNAVRVKKCDTHHILEADLEEAFCSFFDDAEPRSVIKQIMVFNDKVEFVTLKGATKLWQRQ